jgi:hypothetical protein
MATTRLSTTTALRTYRVYVRDSSGAFTRSEEVDLASDDDVRQLAVLTLDKQTTHHCVEVWDRARLVCSVRRDSQ